MILFLCFFFFSSRRRHTRWTGDWSSDVCSSDLKQTDQIDDQKAPAGAPEIVARAMAGKADPAVHDIAEPDAEHPGDAIGGVRLETEQDQPGIDRDPDQRDESAGEYIADKLQQQRPVLPDRHRLQPRAARRMRFSIQALAIATGSTS